MAARLVPPHHGVVDVAGASAEALRALSAEGPPGTEASDLPHSAEGPPGTETLDLPHSVEELFAGARQRRARNALHLALTANDSAAAARLIESGGPALLNQPSVTGVTPLMLAAMGHCEESLIWRLLERRATANVALRSETRRTAADYAAEKESKRTAEVVEALRALEAEEVRRTAKYRCPVCGDVVKRRPVLAYFWEQAERGREENVLLQRFFGKECYRPLLQPRYHQVNDLRQVRKELSESMSMVEALLRAQPSFGNGWRVVDLCCGRSITAALISLRFQGASVVAVDKLATRFLPHFDSDGGGCQVRYAQLDVLHEQFVEDLQRLLRQDPRPTALLGMHLCGRLSLRAIEAYAQLREVQAVVLCPCCLPGKGDAGSPPHLYETKDAAEQYLRWALHLETVLRGAAAGAAVGCETAAGVLSPRNAVITATKVGALSPRDAAFTAAKAQGNPC